MSEKLQILKLSSVDLLKSKIAENLPRYENGDGESWLRFLEEEEHLDPIRTTGIEISNLSATLLKIPQSKNFFDADNCCAVFRALESLKPSQAADERVWVHMSHCIFPDYTRKRWPIPANADQAAKCSHIGRHWFVTGGNRGLMRDNAISRLWWMGYAVSRCGLDFEDTLAAVLHKQDVRKNMFERSFCASPQIFKAMAKCAIESLAGQQKLFLRENFRKLTNELNRVGGKLILDSLGSRGLDGLISRLICDELKLDPENL